MKTVIGNWKMHGTRALAQSLARAVAHAPHVVLCPPAVWVGEVAAALKGGKASLGGQDCHAEASGAFTGDISAAMLREAGCRYVIVGHSERRQGHGETDALVAAKAARAQEAGLIPIICVGESLAERESGQAEAVVARQVKAALPSGQFLLAYEPIWAIGTGRTPAPADIHAMHAHIATLAPGAQVVYGGSVNASNAASILALPEVHGVLVGGASVKETEFMHIVQAAE